MNRLHSGPNYGSILLSLLLALFVAGPASAQPAADGPAGVSVSIKGLDLSWSDSGSLTLGINDINGYRSTEAAAYESETPQLVARLLPGKFYDVFLSGSNIDLLTLQAVPQAGYVMEIERVPRERMTIYGLGYSVPSARLRVLSPASQFAARGGTATGLSSGLVYWQASLGSLANGTSAGAIGFIDTGTTFSSSLFTPQGLIYQATSAEVEVIENGSGVSSPYVPGTIRQIIAPEVCADVVLTSSAQCEIKFYHPSQKIPGSGVPYQFTGDPFAWYLINPNGFVANQVQIDCHLRNVPTPTSSGQPVVQVKTTTLQRSGTAPDFTWTAKDWYVSGQTPLSEEVRSRSSGAETSVVSGPGGTATSSGRTYGSVPWGEEITSETAGTGSVVTTAYAYYSDTNQSQSGSYGRLLSRQSTGGGWEAYEYYDYASNTADQAGALRRTHRPFKDLSSSTPDLSLSTAHEVTEFTYAPDPFGRKTRLTSVETKVGGVPTARATIAYVQSVATFNGHPELNLVMATRQDYAASGSSLTTVTKYFREDSGTTASAVTDDFYRNQIHSVVRPDGVKQSFAYQRGSWDGSTFTFSGNGGADIGPASRIAVITGSEVTGTWIATFDGYNIEDIGLIDGKSTAEITIRDVYARVVRTESRVWTSTLGWQPVAWVNYAYNLANQPTSRTSSNGATYAATYNGERKETETDETGVTVTYGYDDANRIWTAAKAGGPTTTFAYDAGDRVRSQTVGTGTGETITTLRAYDDAGRVTSETPAGLGATTYAYDPTSRTRTANLPHNATRLETYFPDGQLKSLTGSAVVPEYYDYAVESDGRRTQQVNLGTAGSPRYRLARNDWLGRTVHTERPGFTGQPTFAEDYSYHPTTGQLTQLTRTGSAPVLYEYDALGRVNRTGLRRGGTGGLDPASTDRITDSDQFFEHYAGAWWLSAETKIYPTAGSGASKTASYTRRRLTEYPANRLEEVQSTDIEGNTMVRTVDVNTATKTATITTTRPGVANPQIETIVNRLPSAVQGHDGLSVTSQFDSLERPWKTTDTRNNTTTVAYKPGSSLVYTVTDAANNPTTYGYDSSGRRAWVQDASTQVTRFSYNARSQLFRQWGSGSYPVQYGYDATYGDRTSHSTYRNGTSGDAAEWPEGASAADTTTLLLDGPSGLLWKKTDAANHPVTYTYNERGQTATRTWARGVVTTYGYEADTGEPNSTTYSDGTPAVSYGYTRLGQLDFVTDGVTGTREFDYDPTDPLRQTREVFDGSFYASRVISRIYNTASGTGGGYGSHTAGFVKGRAVGFELGVIGNPGRDLHQNFTYSDLGRFAGVNTRAATSTARDFVYNYTPEGLLGGYNSGAFTLSYGYETTRNLRTKVDGLWGSTKVSGYDSAYNSIGQRRWSKQSGSAFADYTTGTGYSATTSYYDYNGRGELHTTAMYRVDNPSLTPPASTEELPGRRFEYRYDSIGNRVTAGSTGTANSGDDEYAANNLNQYDTKENNTVRVLGTAAPNASVAVANATVTKKDRAFAADVLPPNPNAAGPAQGSVTLYAALVGGGPGGTDLIGLQTRSWAIAKLLQAFSYDDDGNMTGDGVWTYAYDAENRLKSMTATTAALNAGFPNRSLEFKYDYLGRRVQKRSLNATASTDVYRRYLYDGWALIAETDTAGTITRSYTWGLDLAGSLNATGGVGALVQITNHNANDTRTSYFPTYDDNGNVASLVREDGALAAAYEYSPAGELLRNERFDSAIADNPFKFSTKFTDDESGLVYYGARFYSPALGRFINRDPIEEQGGLNLYGFCGNDGVNNTDYLGYSWLSKQIGSIGRWINKNKQAIITVVAIVASIWVGGALGGLVNTALSGTTMTVAASGAVTVTATGSGLMAASLAAAAPVIGGIVGGAAGGALAGGIMTGTVKGALQGAAAGAIMGGVQGFYGTAFPVDRIAATGVAGGLGSEIQGGNFRDGFKLNGAIAAATWTALWMRNVMIKDSLKNPDNAAGVSEGFNGDRFKLGGGRFDPNFAPNSPKQIQPFGGFQGGDRKLFGFAYQAGGIADRVIESFAGPHDWLGSWWSYNELGNNSPKDSIFGRLLGKFGANIMDSTMATINIPLAAPLVASSWIGLSPYSSVALRPRG